MDTDYPTECPFTVKDLVPTYGAKVHLGWMRVTTCDSTPATCWGATNTQANGSGSRLKAVSGVVTLVKAWHRQRCLQHLLRRSQCLRPFMWLCWLYCVPPILLYNNTLVITVHNISPHTQGLGGQVHYPEDSGWGWCSGPSHHFTAICPSIFIWPPYSCCCKSKNRYIEFHHFNI